MILDIARLLLFPAVMAFAAASDLLTMTISNRVSLVLCAGFFILALASGMGAADMLSHAGAGALVLGLAFGCFAMGWIGGGDAKIAAAAALWFGFGHLMNYLLYAGAHRPGLAYAAACQGGRHPLWRRTRHRRLDDLPGDRMAEGGRLRAVRDGLGPHVSTIR